MIINTVNRHEWTFFDKNGLFLIQLIAITIYIDQYNFDL